MRDTISTVRYYVFCHTCLCSFEQSPSQHILQYHRDHPETRLNIIVMEG